PWQQRGRGPGAVVLAGRSAVHDDLAVGNGVAVGIQFGADVAGVVEPAVPRIPEAGLRIHRGAEGVVGGGPVGPDAEDDVAVNVGVVEVDVLVAHEVGIPAAHVVWGAVRA